MRSLCAVTLNPAIDRTFYVDSFNVDSLNRASRVVNHAGGKGINVSVLAAKCGLRSFSTGFIAGAEGKFIETFLTESGVRADFVHIPGATRTNIKIVDLKAGTYTDLNESGPSVTAADLERLCDVVKALSQKCDVVAMGGSLPPGCPMDIYARLVRIAKDEGAFTVLDAGGEELRHGIGEKPHLIKPNLLEVSLMLGYTPENPAEAAREIVGMGVGTVLISMGAEGAVAAAKEGTYRALPIKVNVKSTVGAGDSFLTGFIYGISQGLNTRESLKYAVSFATAKVREEGTFIPPFERLIEFINEAQILEGESTQWGDRT